MKDLRPDFRRRLVEPAVVGAMYCILTMVLAPLSYGAVQFRVSEALCVLPFYEPYTAFGLAVGCAVSNTLSAAGLPDVVFGSLATLASGLCTAAIGRASRRNGRSPSACQRLAACLMPVIWNGTVIGAVLAGMYTPGAFRQGFLVMGGEVALGELGVMLLLGWPLLKALPRIEAGLGRK